MDAATATGAIEATNPARGPGDPGLLPGLVGERVADLHWPVRGRVLLGLPVDAGGAEVGRVRDVIFDAAFRRVLGLNVQRPSGRQSFVPWVAVSLARGRAGVHNAHALLSATELAYYIAHGALLTSLHAPLLDVLVSEGGQVEEVVRLHPAAGPSGPFAGAGRPRTSPEPDSAPVRGERRRGHALPASRR